MHSLAKFPRKKDQYNEKRLGVIGKREYENDVVWITLQDRQFRWKKLNIPNVKGDGTDAMSIFYNIPNNRDFVFKHDTVQDIETTITSVPIFVMLPSILGPIFCGEAKIHGSFTEL